jgi:CHAT domain-containing protein/tetratricopeptide (TPR) repeat protein
MRSRWRVLLAATLAASCAHGDAGPPPRPSSAPAAEGDRLAESARRLFEQGQREQALVLARRALAARERALGPDHPDVARALVELGRMLVDAGDLASPEPLFRRALAARERVLGPDHLDVADSAQALGMLLAARGEIAAAEPLHRRALAIRQRALGPEHPDVAESLLDVAHVLRKRGEPAAAEPLARRAVVILERARGPDHPDVALAVSDLAFLLEDQGRLAEAEPLLRRALAIREKRFGADSVWVGGSLNNLGALFVRRGEPMAAEPLQRRALAILEKNLGQDHPSVASALNGLATVLVHAGHYEEAEALFRRALTIRRRAFRPDNPELVETLVNLGVAQATRGDLGGAEATLRDAITLQEAAPATPATQARLATTLADLAKILGDRGKLVEAEELVRRSLRVREETLGANHPDVAISLNNLATYLTSRGDRAAAEPLLRRAVAIDEKALGPDHKDLGMLLDNLANLLDDDGDTDGGERLHRRALAIDEKALGPDHPSVALKRANLAAALAAKGDLAGAEEQSRRAVAIGERALGPEHPEVATLLDNLASILVRAHGYAAAEPVYRRVLAIRERSLGPDHPDVAASLYTLAWLLVGVGRSDEAFALERRAAEIEEKVMDALLATGSARQKALFFATMEARTHALISLHAQHAPADERAARLALTTILRRKGRVLDASADTVRALRDRADPGDVQRLEELASLRGELATRSLRGPLPSQSPEAHAAVLAELRARADESERALAPRYAALRRPGVVSIEVVQRRLPARAALVEMVRYRPRVPQDGPSGDGWQPWRYIAYVLTSTGAPRWLDLGDADSLDQLVADARGSLLASDLASRSALRALDERLMRPLRALLGDRREVYLSPDGALNLVPFAALLDERGHFLVSRYRFTFLTSGRDLLRETPPATSRAPVVVAGADYGPRQAGSDLSRAPGPARGVRSVDLGSFAFPPLPGAAREGQQVAALVPGARLLLGDAATEEAVKALRAPRLLHIATHGFFLDEPPRAPASARAAALVDGAAAARDAPAEDPLLRSGLVFAGANARRSAGGTDDGILTALEVADLDLQGTRLVVLSACETALGRVTSGDGVYGLRRALVLAGSESQIMSLWKVDDDATRLLMTDFYARLRRGEGRGDALRNAQLALLAHPGTADPFYWAAFISAGDPR